MAPFVFLKYKNHSKIMINISTITAIYLYTSVGKCKSAIRHKYIVVRYDGFITKY